MSDQMTKIVLEGNHAEWLSNPLNKALLNQIENERQQYLRLAEQSCECDSAELKIRLLVNKAKTLRDLIEKIKTKPEMLAR